MTATDTEYCIFMQESRMQLAFANSVIEENQVETEIPYRCRYVDFVARISMK